MCRIVDRGWEIMCDKTDEELVACAREALRRGLLLPDLAASLCPGVIAVKTWCRDDIKVALQEKGLEGTEDEIDHVLNASLVASLLKDPTDEDFEIINQGVSRALEKLEHPLLTPPETQFLTEIVSKINANVYGVCVSDDFWASLTYVKIRWEEVNGYCGEAEIPVSMPFAHIEHGRWYEPAELGIGDAHEDKNEL